VRDGTPWPEADATSPTPPTSRLQPFPDPSGDKADAAPPARAALVIDGTAR
jgi:hypothetical protein